VVKVQTLLLNPSHLIGRGSPRKITECFDRSITFLVLLYRSSYSVKVTKAILLDHDQNRKSIRNPLAEKEGTTVQCNKLHSVHATNYTSSQTSLHPPHKSSRRHYCRHILLLADIMAAAAAISSRALVAPSCGMRQLNSVDRVATTNQFALPRMSQSSRVVCLNPQIVISGSTALSLVSVEACNEWLLLIFSASWFLQSFCFLAQ
jgi:hypothetical protein